MVDRGPFGPGVFVTRGRTFGTRLGGPVGCLATLVLCPIGIVVGVVMLVITLFRGRRAPAAAPSPWPRAGAPTAGRDAAVRRLVSVFADDEAFTADDVRQAGTPDAGGATADDLLADAIQRGYIDVTSRGLVVTKKGRAAAGLDAAPDALRG